MVISCQSEKVEPKNDLLIKNKVQVDNLEIEVISHTIKDLIHPTPPPPPPPRLKESEEDYNKRVTERSKEFREYCDTTIFTFYHSDSLTSFNFSNENYPEFHIQSNKSDAKKISIEKIKTEEQFKLSIEKPDDNWNNWENEFIGIVQYSRIIFNDDYSKALFHCDFICGGLCGGGSIVLAEKKKDKWIIINNEHISTR